MIVHSQLNVYLLRHVVPQIVPIPDVPPAARATDAAISEIRNIMLNKGSGDILRRTLGKISHGVPVRDFFALLAHESFWHLGKIGERKNGPFSLSIVLD